MKHKCIKITSVYGRDLIKKKTKHVCKAGYKYRITNISNTQATKLKIFK